MSAVIGEDSVLLEVFASVLGEGMLLLGEFWPVLGIAANDTIFDL